MSGPIKLPVRTERVGHLLALFDAEGACVIRREDAAIVEQIAEALNRSEALERVVASLEDDERYLSAVKGRQEFREAYRRERERVKELEAQIAAALNATAPGQAAEGLSLMERLGNLRTEELLSPEARTEGDRVLREMAQARQRAADRARVTPLSKCGMWDCEMAWGHEGPHFGVGLPPAEPAGEQRRCQKTRLAHANRWHGCEKPAEHDGVCVGRALGPQPAEAAPGGEHQHDWEWFSWYGEMRRCRDCNAWERIASPVTPAPADPGEELRLLREVESSLRAHVAVLCGAEGGFGERCLACGRLACPRDRELLSKLDTLRARLRKDDARG